MTEKTFPPAFFITFITYGTRLHGDSRGTVNRNQNQFGSQFVSPNDEYCERMHKKLQYQKFLLNESQRKTVLKSIVYACKHYHWHLIAAHVRSNHIHFLLNAEKDPDFIAIKVKAFATRFLKKSHPEIPIQKYWTRGQSTRYVWKKSMVYVAADYIIERQGEKMAYYFDEGYQHMLLSKTKLLN